MTGDKTCASCRSYRKGRLVCADGFPLPYGGILPLCLRDDHDLPPHLFNDDGSPRLYREDAP